VKIQELALGVGPEAKAGDRLVLDYVLRSAVLQPVSACPEDATATVAMLSLLQYVMQAIQWLLHIRNSRRSVLSAS